MVKVVKHGKAPNTIRRFVCTHCGCVFDADENDYNEAGQEKMEPFYACRCPDCGHYAFSVNQK